MRQIKLLLTSLISQVFPSSATFKLYACSAPQHSGPGTSHWNTSSDRLKDNSVELEVELEPEGDI